MPRHTALHFAQVLAMISVLPLIMFLSFQVRHSELHRPDAWDDGRNCLKSVCSAG